MFSFTEARRYIQMILFHLYCLIIKLKLSMIIALKYSGDYVIDLAWYYF